MTDDPCPGCGSPSPGFWCCTPTDDGGEPWRTLAFYDFPRTSWRMRDGFVEIRESHEGTSQDGRPCIEHTVVTLETNEIHRIAREIDRMMKGE